MIKHTWHKMVSMNGIIDQDMLSIANTNMFDNYLDNHYDESVNEINCFYQSYFLTACYEPEH